MIINGTVGCVSFFIFLGDKATGSWVYSKVRKFHPSLFYQWYIFKKKIMLLSDTHVWPLRKCIGNGEIWWKCKNLMLYIVMVFKTIQTNCTHVKINIYIVVGLFTSSRDNISFNREQFLKNSQAVVLVVLKCSKVYLTHLIWYVRVESMNFFFW